MGTLEERLVARLAAHFAPHVAARLERRLHELRPMRVLDGGLRRLWVRRWVGALPPAERRDAFAAARWLAADLRRLLVTQRQTRLSIADSIEDDDFLDRRMTLLLSGLANCELMAVLLAEGLGALGHAATVWSTGDAVAHHGAHTLVHVESPAGTAFADAWSDEPLFHVPGVRSASAGPDRAPPGVPERDALGRRSIERHGVYPKSAYRAGQPKRIASRRARSLLGWPALGPPEPVAPVHAEFVALRLRHLVGALTDPERAYRALAERPDLPDALAITLAALARPR